ncbi:hypothetical protein SEA_ANNADREAMY_66 [Streptomyces phage Annadreamy]|uniref:Uncharacterized protein n=2 Tax=Annadreamyvirus annadreamy TaxID=2846392 RepID=A0A345GTB4_9CAUD|nr:hypothetical protein HWB75_gp180 [Streptomyces phage Annadreamy]AXG66186.1 hypothetical protein SEA_ANNADREAMY_66 [Streptomyces phage Annadreamy]QGH79398.1 hypothetical protein SEA_LIMPID_65 [Streptomyces phage Limpid]
MSRFFVLPEDGIGPGGQIYFRKHKGNDRWYNLFLDDKKVGMIMKDPVWNNWNAISYCDDSRWFAVRTMDGFSRRMAAAEFIIKHWGYWLSDERENIKSEIRAEKFITKFRMNKTLEIMKGHRKI